MPTPEGHASAIRATKVIGTQVLSTSGEKIGKIEDVMLDKQGNNIIFAVVGFDGHIGVNEKFHPLPRSGLDYSRKTKGDVVS